MTRDEPDATDDRAVFAHRQTAERPGSPHPVEQDETQDEDDRPDDDQHDDAGQDDAGQDDAGKDDAGQDAETAAHNQENADQETRKKRRPRVLLIAIVVMIGLALGGVYWWLSGLNVEETDDAYTDGRSIQIAPQIAGRVVSLDVGDNQFVHKGQALIHIDPRQFINTRDQNKGAVDTAIAQLSGQVLGAEIAQKNYPAALQAAEADLAAAKANLSQKQADFARQKSLPRQATTQQEVDAATANLQSAQAQVLQAQARVTQAQPVKQNIGQAQAQVKNLSGQLEQAEAKLHQADLDLSHTVIRAPQDGWVTKRNVEMGNYVTAGQQIFYLVSPDVWVTANFKETQLNLMRPGQSVDITIDAFPDLKLRGHVDSIQLGSGSKFSAFPAENATGNFVKIVQRVPVKIIIDSGLDPTIPLPLGLSVTPTITVR